MLLVIIAVVAFDMGGTVGIVFWILALTAAAGITRYETSRLPIATPNTLHIMRVALYVYIALAIIGPVIILIE